MGLVLSDFLMPWRKSRWQSFLQGPGAVHAYMVHVGAGWTLARLPFRIERSLTRMNPLLRWLAVDGFGFHEGYFHSYQAIERQAIPNRLCGYGLRAFDQGLGRSLWFARGADVHRIRQTVESFPRARQADLWSGLGLACTYAGGVAGAAIEALNVAAGEYRPHLAQGAAFAAKARQRAGNPAEHTERSCALLCGVSAATAAAITDAALLDLPGGGASEPYETWRSRIRANLASERNAT